MKKEVYLKTHTLEEYEVYKRKQAELAKRWRERNREKSRRYGLDYYYRRKNEKNKE